MNHFPNYDAWKLASPDDQHSDLCRDCDEDEIFNQAHANAWYEFKPFYDQFEASKATAEKLLAKLRDEKAFDVIIDSIEEIIEDIEDAQADMQMRLNEEHLAKLKSEAGICRQCHDEDHADDDRDDY